MNPNTDVDDLPPDTFNKESGNSVEELKLRVAYISPTSPEGSSEDDASKNSQSFDTSSSQALQNLKEERDAAARQTRQLQQELVTVLHISLHCYFIIRFNLELFQICTHDGD